MKHSKQKTYLIIILIAAIAGCKNIFKPAAENGEGTVVYKVIYGDNNPYKNKMMLPHQTKLIFKGTKAGFITSAMGIVEMINLLDNDSKKFTSMLVNKMGQNYAFVEAPDDVKLQESNPKYEIETTSVKKMIAGLECNKAVVNDVTNNKKFDIWYYEKVKLYLGDSPYKDFNYLLMQYEDTRYGLPMKLEARKVNLNPIDTAQLSVHGDFNWVDKKTFLNIVNNL